MANQIRLEPEWIPRSENEHADFISTIEDFDDWKLDPKEFAKINNLWGPHSIDRFADVYNRQTERFNSRFWNPESEAVDAFTCNWGNENNWLCPPVHLINRVVQHAKKTNAQVTLIVPGWQSAPFWPVIFPDGYTPANLCKKCKSCHKERVCLSHNIQEQCHLRMYLILKFLHYTLILPVIR